MVENIYFLESTLSDGAAACTSVDLCNRRSNSTLLFLVSSSSDDGFQSGVQSLHFFLICWSPHTSRYVAVLLTVKTMAHQFMHVLTFINRLPTRQHSWFIHYIVSKTYTHMHKHITVMSLRLKKQIISSYTDADMLRLSYLFKNPSACIQSLENTHTRASTWWVCGRVCGFLEHDGIYTNRSKLSIYTTHPWA